jgi:PiT family inorganic phosphate transporter
MCYSVIALNHVRRLAHRQTMGTKITKLKPIAVSALKPEPLAPSSAHHFWNTLITTHTITGAIAASARRKTFRCALGLAGNIIWAWILTIPISAVIPLQPTYRFIFYSLKLSFANEK